MSPTKKFWKHSINLVMLISVVLFCSEHTFATKHEAEPTSDLLTIDNFSNEAIVRYDLPILKGTLTNGLHVTVHNLTNGSRIKWQVSSGRWRAFVPLSMGNNALRIETDTGRKFSFSLIYQPQTNQKKVRLVYSLASDSAGKFDAPVGQPNDVSHAKARIALMGRMIQSLTAEFMAEAGAAKTTFDLLRDSNGHVLVDTPRSSLTVSNLWSKNDVEIYFHLLSEFESYPNRSDFKDLAIIADTHYDASTNTLRAHTARGGEHLALFGGGTLYSFPETVEEIESHFLDATAIESYLFPEYGRAKQYWAAVTTSQGAILHEVGHSFGLPHPDHPQPGDIMQRGFDYLNRAITTSEPGLGAVDPNTNVMPKWTQSDKQTLEASPWFQSGVSGGGNGQPVLLAPQLSASPASVVVIAKAGDKNVRSIPIHIQVDWTDVTWIANHETGAIPNLNFLPMSGGSDSIAHLQIDPSGYAIGEYRDSIRITASNNQVENNPQTIDIRLIIADQVTNIYLPVVQN